MDTTIRTWLDDDRSVMHHAPAGQLDGMHSQGFAGRTHCGRQGFLKLVHHENVDVGLLCPECMVITGPNPPLEGTGLGPP